ALTDLSALLLLDPAGKGALSATGNGEVLVSGGGQVVINSANPAAAIATGNSQVIAADFEIAGAPGVQTTGNARFAGVVPRGVAQGFAPLVSLSAPQPSATPFPAVNYSGKTPLVLSPGTYAGGITISGQGAVTLLPGL